jgi:hypothetical protein
MSTPASPNATSHLISNFKLPTSNSPNHHSKMTGRFVALK